LKTDKYFDELIKLEENVAQLYILFSEKLNKYKDFWYKLSIEEYNHASLLETAKLFHNSHKLPKEFIKIEILDEVIKTNSMFKYYKTTFLNNPTISNAKKIAIEIEYSAGEIHYENTISNDIDDYIINIFKKLNEDDYHHLKRIENL